jgi:hypothetical protein
VKKDELKGSMLGAASPLAVAEVWGDLVEAYHVV